MNPEEPTITSTEDICGGSPRISGTRLTCANVVQLLSSEGANLEWFLNIHPNVAEEDVRECIEYCGQQKCVTQNVLQFCQGCSLRAPDPEPDTDCDLEEETTRDVWLLAQQLNRNGI